MGYERNSGWTAQSERKRVPRSCGHRARRLRAGARSCADRASAWCGVVGVALGGLIGFASAGCSRKADPGPGISGGFSSATSTADTRAPEARPTAQLAVGASTEPILVGGQATGYARFPDGLVIRSVNQTCPSMRPRSKECRSTRHGCKTDAECSTKPNGYCADVGDSLGCGCHYGCLSDGDCAQNQLCLCGDPVGSCIEAKCGPQTCGAPEHCATYHDGCVFQPFACREHARARSCSF